MRKFVSIASVVVLAAGSANCVNSHPGVNSASTVLPMASVVGPSALEARSSGGNGRGNTGAGSSLTLVMVDDARVIGPSWGDIVRFDVSTKSAAARAGFASAGADDQNDSRQCQDDARHLYAAQLLANDDARKDDRACRIE